MIDRSELNKPRSGFESITDPTQSCSAETERIQPENGILFNGVSSAGSSTASQSHRLHPTELLLPTIASLHLGDIDLVKSGQLLDLIRQVDSHLSCKPLTVLLHCWLHLLCHSNLKPKM